jgi:hypothetical protein
MQPLLIPYQSENVKKRENSWEKSSPIGGILPNLVTLPVL